MNPDIDATGGLLTEPSEYSLMQSAKANAEERAREARNRFPNAPENTTCKICQTVFPNPILEGSSIVISTCQGCRTNMLGSRAKNKAIKQGIVSKRQLERADNAVSEAPATTSDPTAPQHRLPPVYLKDFAPNEEEE